MVLDIFNVGDILYYADFNLNEAVVVMVTAREGDDLDSLYTLQDKNKNIYTDIPNDYLFHREDSCIAIMLFTNEKILFSLEGDETNEKYNKALEGIKRILSLHPMYYMDLDAFHVGLEQERDKFISLASPSQIEFNTFLKEEFQKIYSENK